MPQDRHFGTGSDTMQQVHGAGVKSNLRDYIVGDILYYFLIN